MLFYKYQGAGNDFIMLDNTDLTFDGLLADSKLVERLCHRRYGVGADGLIALEKSDKPNHHFRMRYFNSDGLEGSMCGNGGRCAVAFAHFLNPNSPKQLLFDAVDGQHSAIILDDNRVELGMIDVNQIEEVAPKKAFFLNTGSPHYVSFVENLAQTPVVEEGKAIRYSPFYANQGGTNVNFIEVDTNTQTLHIRTYERGVEDETYACGTGAVASAMAWATLNNWTGPVHVNLIAQGGKLGVKFERTKDNQFKNVALTGNALQVFSGQLAL